MCQHKVLAHNKQGYIIQCNKCNHFQIGFGTAIVCFTTVQFEKFIKQAELQQEIFGQEENTYPNYKKVALPTFSRNVQLMMSYQELNKMCELIEEANVMIQLEKMLEPKKESN